MPRSLPALKSSSTAAECWNKTRSGVGTAERPSRSRIVARRPLIRRPRIRVVRIEQLCIMLVGQGLQALQRLQCLHRIVVARLNAHHVEILLRVAGIRGEQHGLPMCQLDHQAVMSRCMTNGFEQEHTLGDLLIAGQRFEARRVEIGRDAALDRRSTDIWREADFGVCELLLRRRRFKYVEFTLMTNRRCMSAMLVAAAM